AEIEEEYLAAYCIREHLVQSIENFIYAITEIAGFFNILKRELSMLCNILDAKIERHCKIVKPKASRIVNLCNFFVKNLPHCTNLQAIPDDCSKNYVQKWLATQNGWILLHISAVIGDIRSVRTLLQQNCDINIHDEDGKTALYWAAEYRYTEIVKFLLEVEAEADNKPNLNLVHFAAERNYENVKIGIVLHWAVFEGHKETVNYLIKNNINLVKAIDKNDKTALYEAVWNAIISYSCQEKVFNLLRNDDLKNDSLAKFFNQLDNKQLNNYYKIKLLNDTTLGLSYKFQNLENLFHKLKNETLGKIYTLKSASESILIIDINEYLNSIVSETKLLQDK
ncbi:21216_t:CDS:2, partial [Racocetra persica]